METNDVANKSTESESKFTGSMLANYFINLIAILASIITLGIAYPAMVCWKLKWEANHTYLNGKKLTFDGNAIQLFGSYLLWLFLSIITFGLYYIFSAKLNLTEWITKHTHFADYNYDEKDSQSKFNGKWYQLFGVNFICNFVILITFTLGYYWAHCYKERWYCKHKTIDGCKIQFNGTGMQYFAKRIVWTLLTVITLGIYVFWLQIKSVKWTVSHTELIDVPDENNFTKREEIVEEPSLEELQQREELRKERLRREELRQEELRKEALRCEGLRFEPLNCEALPLAQGEKIIRDRAFKDCGKLTGVAIPDTVKSIGEYAFKNCKNLREIYIPNSVVNIGFAIFYGCQDLTVYCQAPSEPKGWNGSWYYSGGKVGVVWGYKGNLQIKH